jgi:hypothetical protein
MLRKLLMNPTDVGTVFANRIRACPSEQRRTARRPVGRTGGSQRPTPPAA